jgi:hypothetical protein
MQRVLRQERGGNSHSHRHQPGCGKQSPRAPLVEIHQRQFAGAIDFAGENARDQKPGDDEEEVDTEITAAGPGHVGMEKHDGDDGQRPQAIQPAQPVLCIVEPRFSQPGKSVGRTNYVTHEIRYAPASHAIDSRSGSRNEPTRSAAGAINNGRKGGLFAVYSPRFCMRPVYICRAADISPHFNVYKQIKSIKSKAYARRNWHVGCRGFQWGNPALMRITPVTPPERDGELACFP